MDQSSDLVGYKEKYEKLLKVVQKYLGEVSKKVRDIEKLQNSFQDLKKELEEE